MSYRAVITCPCSSTLWVIMQKVNNLCGISVSDNWKWQVSTIWENGQHQPLCSQPLPLSQGLKTPEEAQEHMVERCPFWQHGEEVSSLGDTSNVLRVTQSWTARAWCNHSWITHPLLPKATNLPITPCNSFAQMNHQMWYVCLSIIWVTGCHLPKHWVESVLLCAERFLQRQRESNADWQIVKPKKTGAKLAL